jgi:thiol:disulfide interchange protein DsbG
MRQSRKGLAALLLMCAIAMGWGTTAAAASQHQVAESMLSDIGMSTWIAEGKGPHVVYIFFDPNCPYCHKLYKETRPYLKRGGFQLRWIPVGILTATSRGKAASILMAKDRLAALHENERKFDYSGGLGGIDEAIGPDDAAAKSLAANEELLSRMTVPSVPAMLFRADDDSALLVSGSPPPDKLQFFLSHVK